MARWLEHGKADHYAHAEVYALLAELALPRPFDRHVTVGGSVGCGLLAGLE